MAQDNITKVHQLLLNDGYDDVGTEDEFRAFVSEKSNAKKVHQLLLNDGYDDVGSEDEFLSWIGVNSSNSADSYNSGQDQQAAVPEAGGVTQPAVDDSRGRVPEENVPAQQPAVPTGASENNVVVDEAVSRSVSAGGQLGGTLAEVLQAKREEESGNNSSNSSQAQEAAVPEEKKEIAGAGELQGDYLVGPWHKLGVTSGSEEVSASNETAQTDGQNVPQFYQEGIVVNNELVTPLEEVKRYNRAHDIPEGSDAEEMQRYHTSVATENMRDYVNSLSKEALALMPEEATVKQRENALNIVTRAVMGKKSKDAARLQQEASWLGVTPEEYWNQFILPNLRDAIGMNAPWNPMGVAEQLQAERDAYNPYIDEYGRPMPTGRVNPMAIQRIERKKQREAIEADVMKTFEEQLAVGKEAAQSKAKDIMVTDYGGQGAQGTVVNFGKMREANQLSAPENAINAAIGRLDELTKGMSEEQRALFGAQMYQQLQGRLVNERKANSTIEQIFKSAFLNSVTGKMTVGAVQTDYENYLDQLAAKAYDPSFMTEVASEVGSFLFDFWTFLGPQAVGGLAARGAVKSAVNKISKDLVARGLGKRQAGRIAEQIASQSLKTKVGSHAINGATTFGLHGFATSPVNTLTQPTGAESTRSLDAMSGTEHQEPTVGPTDIIGRMFTDMGWGAAGGALFGAGAIPEHYITNRFGHGLASSLAGKGASIATNAAGMTGVGALEYYDENGKPMSWSELGQNYLKNVAMFATLDVPGFIASRNAAKKNQYFRENYEITPSDVAKMRDLGFGDRLTDIAVKLADPSQELAGRPSRSDVTDVNALKPEDRDVTNGLHQLDLLYDEGAITEKEARKWYALLTGDYRRGLNTATAVRAVETDGKHYVEWLDRDGRVIDRQAAKSSEDASATVQRETWQVQLNQIDALEKRVVADDITNRWDAAALKDGWAAGMSEEYISALRDKESRGEALTEEEQWVLKNNESFRSGLEKMSRGESLSKDEQQSVDATMKLLGKMAGESGALQDIVMDFESRHGLEHGKLKTILEKRERSTDEQALVEDYVATLQDNILGRERVRPEQFTRKQIEGPSQEETGLEGNNRIIDGGAPEVPSEAPERPDYRGEGVALMRDALANDDGQAVALAGRESRIAEARVARAFGDSVLADELTAAVNSDADLDAFIASHENELTAEQRSAVEALSAANERMRGIESAVTEMGPQRDQIRAEIASRATEENTVVEMELADGSRVYLRSGDPENEYGTVMVTDAAGQNRQVSTRDIKTIGEVQPVDDLLAAAFNQAVDEYSQRVNDWIDNTALTPGREFTISAAGEEARAVIDRVEGNDVIVRSADNPEETFSLSADEVRGYLREEETKAVEDSINSINSADSANGEGGQPLVSSDGQTGVNGANPNEEPEQRQEKLSPNDAISFVSEMENRAAEAPEVELTIENWDALFGEDGIVNTPIGEVKMGENQFTKLMRKGREGKLGMIKPTLENPDVVIETPSEANEGQITERNSSYIFVKAFTKADGSRYYYFTSVTVSKDGREVVVSNQEKNRNKLLRLLTEGDVIWRTPKDATTSSAEGQGLDYVQPLKAETATEGSGITPQSISSESKITNTPDTGQINGQENEGGNGNSGTVIDGRPRSNRRKASLTPMQQRERALGDYLDFYDYVERTLAASGRGLKVIWGDDPVTGTRGLGAHLTGQSESERRQYIWLLGTKKNGAFYPEQLAEELWQGYREERNDNGLPIDDIGSEQASDAFGVVLDVLRSHNRKESMMREAEERHSDMQRQYDEAERDQANNWAIGQGFEDIDEWQDYSDYCYQKAEEDSRYYDEVISIFAEQYEQEDNERRITESHRVAAQSDEGAVPGRTGEGPAVVQGEQESPAGERDTTADGPSPHNAERGNRIDSDGSLGTGTGEGREVGRAQSGNLPASVAPLVADLERQSDERDALHQAWLSNEIDDSENRQRLRALDEQMSELRRRIIPLLSSLSQEELNAISAYGEEHQLVELPIFVEDEERRRKVAKTEADRFAEGLEAQGSIPHGKAVAKFKASDFASKDSTHAALGGTYYDPDGYAVTTDGFVLIADKQRYDPTKEGKVIAERNIPTVAGKGMEINVPYPNWKAVIPTGGQRVSVDWNDLLGFIAGVRAKMKVEYDELRERGDLDKTSFRAYTANATVQVRLPNGEIALFDLSRLERMAAAGTYLGTTEFQYKGNDRAVVSANANGTALVMPMNRIPDEATSYYYDMSGSDMVGEPDMAYNKNTANERFNEELESLTEENAREVQLDCGRPNDILLSCGIENKPIRLYGAKLISKAKKHGYDYHDIKNLPQAISNPIAVFEGSQKGSFAILTELQINGNNVLATLTVGKGGHDVDFNIITSVYGKDNNNVVRWINSQKLLYANKEKALDYISVPAPIAGAQSNQELQSAAKVIESFENPKLPERNLFSGEPEIAFNAESEEIFNAAKEKFGRTYDIREAGYVLPDGTMLDFSGRHELFGADDSAIRGSRATDHRVISTIAYKYDNDGNEIETGIETDMPDFIKRGGIRIDDNAGTINLAVKPTPEQREVLRRLIQRNDGDVSVDFGDGWDSDHYVEYEGVRPQRVLADIDRYFEEGIKPEGNVMLQEPQTIYNTLDGQQVVYQSLFESERGNGNNSANRASGQALADEIGGMSDAQLLDRIGESGANDRDFYADEYDRRHEQEYDDAQLAYAQQLEQSNTSLDDAYGMYGDVSRRWLNGGYATDERTALRAQMDALTPYIDFLETERYDEEMEAQREAEREAAKQQYEEQKNAVEAFDPTTLRLRKLEPGETCRVERVYEETGQFNFTGKEKIESAEDVAFIFKQLETASVENAFLVLLKDGRPTIVHLGMGSYNKTAAPFETAFVAYQALKPDTVYFVHNHPSGNLKASRQDQEVLNHIKRAFGEDVVQQGIIIDTTSGNYGEFESIETSYETYSVEEEMPQATGNEIPIKVYQFSKQVFAPDWNPAEAFKVDSSLKVAQFVSSHRLGEHKKMSLLVVTQDMRVVANVFLPWTKLSEIKSYAEAGELLAGYVHQCGGVRGILYGNYDYTKEDDKRLSRLSLRMKQLQAPFLEVMHIGHSASESGLLGEPEVDYNAVNEPQYQLTSSEDVRPATQEEREETAYMADHFNAIGIPTSTDWEEGQRVLDMANGEGVRLQKRLNALQEAERFIEESLSGKHNDQRVEIELPLSTQRKVRRAMGRDFDTHNIYANGIIHSKNNHGVGGMKIDQNSIPLRDEDFKLAPYIMTAPDNVIPGSASSDGRESIRFEKRLQNGVVLVVEKEQKNSPDDMDTITMWATLSSRGADARSNERPLHTTSKPANVTNGTEAARANAVTVISSFDAAKIRRDAEIAIENDEKNAKYQKANVSQAVFVSNARRAVEGIRQEKATPEQWLAMLQKQGGLKAGEDKWLGLSDWLKGQDKKSLTKQEVLDFIDQNQIQIEEVNYSENVDILSATEREIQENIARGHSLEELQEQIDTEIRLAGDELDGMDASERDEWLTEQMKDRYGDDFEVGYSISDGTISYAIGEWDVDEDAYNSNIAGDDNKKINTTRLAYTTEGLENKREIALTVPTIESWNDDDDIHFGDAGGGRAVAWIRFGDSWGREPVEINHPITGEKTVVKRDVRVLVIDEIQSKRHQEGREKGYRTTEAVAEEERLGDAVNKAQEAYDAYTRRMGEKYNGAYEDIYADMTDAERTEADRLEQEVYAASERFQNHGISDIPDAPFEKNWHELAMKRMLRYAAENGYDKVAWTPGEQQAERYNIGQSVRRIDAAIDQEGKRALLIHLQGGPTMDIGFDDEGNITETNRVGQQYLSGVKNISEIVGKEIAAGALSVQGKGTENMKTWEGDNLRIGGEGMKGFYDRMLPSFVNKYVKKWGAKVGEVALPVLEEAAQKMWSVDVTPEMKRDVMQGQPMFFRTPDGQAYGFTLNGKIYLDPRIATAETPIHEYGHLWVEALAEANPEAWEHLKGELEQDADLVNYVKGRYPDLEGDELWEEVFTHFSGRRGRERMEEERRRMMNEEPDLMGKARVARMFYRLRRALKRFWTMARDLFAGNNARLKTMKAEDFADAMMADLVHGFYPRTGELAEQRIRRMADKYNSKQLVFLNDKMDGLEVFDLLDIPEEIFEGDMPTQEEKIAFVEEIKQFTEKSYAFYFPPSDKIIIFAERIPSDREEETFFHENIHAILRSWYGASPAPRRIAEAFWDLAPDEGGEVSKSYIEKKYRDTPEKWKEEFFVTWLGRAMAHGSVDEVTNLLQDSGDKSRIESIEHSLGYDRGEETAARGEGARRTEEDTSRGSQEDGKILQGQRNNRLTSSSDGVPRYQLAGEGGSSDNGTDSSNSSENEANEGTFVGEDGIRYEKAPSLRHQPKRKKNESQMAYVMRLRGWNQMRDFLDKHPRPLEPESFDEELTARWRDAYRAWRTERDKADRGRSWQQLYEYDVEAAVNGAMDGMTKAEAEILEAEAIGLNVGLDIEESRANLEMKFSVIARRKQLEGSNAEDTLFIHGIENRVKALVKSAREAGANITVKKVLETLPYMMEAPRARQIIARQLNATLTFALNRLRVTPADLLRAEAAIAKLRDLNYNPDEAAATPEVIDAAREVAKVLNGEDRTDSANSNNSDRGYITSGDVLAVYDLITARTLPDMSPAMRALMDSAEVKQLLSDIKEWYDRMYHMLDAAGLRRDAGYIAEGYINHVWDAGKSDPQVLEALSTPKKLSAYLKGPLPENRQRTQSPNMHLRSVDTYLNGEALGLVPKYKSLLDIMAHYSRQNNEALANKAMLEDMSSVTVVEKNSSGEVVARIPIITTHVRPIDEEYYHNPGYRIPGLGTVYVHRAAVPYFRAAFGVLRSDVGDVAHEIGRIYDIINRFAKRMNLSVSLFHHLALNEVMLAQRGPFGLAKALFKYIFFDTYRAGVKASANKGFMKYVVDPLLRGESPAFAHPEDFKLAARHLVQLGATSDFAAADTTAISNKISRALYVYSQKHPNKVITSVDALRKMLGAVGKEWDDLLWRQLHDGLKLSLFNRFVEQTDKRLDKLYKTDNATVNGLTRDQMRDRMLDEYGQLVNDTFGGQYWELLGISPKTLKWLRRGILSPDWTFSTMRHFLANFGIGTLYSEGFFKTDEFKRLRSMTAVKCYAIGVLMILLAMNAANIIERMIDEDKEKKKAEEERKTNPDYKSPYELAYPNGMKWYDYTMLGNAPGKQSLLFLGRYSDGRERYLRWGKQFREFPELFEDAEGWGFPRPLLNRALTKGSAGTNFSIDFLGSLGVRGFNGNDRTAQEIKKRHGAWMALAYLTVNRFMPYSAVDVSGLFISNSTEAKQDFHFLDLAMPSSKGYSIWKAKRDFTAAIERGDMDAVEKAYKACVLNGIDAEDVLKSVKSSFTKKEREAFSDGVVDLASAKEAFDNARLAKDKATAKNKIIKYLAESEYKAFTLAEARKQAEAFIKGEDVRQTAEDNERYLMYSTFDDVRDDYRISKLYKKTTEVYVKQEEVATDPTLSGKEKAAWNEANRDWLVARGLINRMNNGSKEYGVVGIKALKKKLGTIGNDDAETMAQIRKMRQETMARIDSLEIGLTGQ